MKISILFLLVFFSFTTFAKPVEIRAGFSLNHFYYQEQDSDNNRLLEEDGFLPKTHGVWRYRTRNAYVSAGFSRMSGDVDYNGQTQNGLPLKTQSKTNIRTYYGEVGLPVATSADIFLRYSRHQWDRDIQSTATSSGLFEHYYWQQLGFGGRYQWIINSQFSVVATALLSQVQNAKVDVDLRPFGGENVTLSMGSANAFMSGISYLYHPTPKVTVGLNTDVYWHRFNESNKKTTILNSRLVTISEPSSETEQFDVGLFVIIHL